jgi:AcrR family transcriptional regulator
MEAMLLELAKRGHEQLEVTAVLARCGVNEAEFEAEFGDLEGCLFTAYEHLGQSLRQRAAERCEKANAEWPERMRAGLEALLGELAGSPEMAAVLTRSFPAIGPEAYSRYLAFLESFVPALSEGRQFRGDGEVLPDSVELLAIGAAETLVVEEVAAGRAEQLSTLVPPILFSVLVPFLGPEPAAAAMRGAGGE